SDNRQMSGTGIGFAFSWSFSKSEAKDEIWYGEFDNYPATLFIHRHSDKYFDGTLAAFHSEGLTYVAIQGNFDPKTNKVTIQELALLPKSTSENWTLGKNQGIMSLDSKELIGKGKGQGSYWWSFSQEDMGSYC
ncbi:MAG: hypothetical protein WBV73_16775, partial [Phormidium sp.]